MKYKKLCSGLFAAVFQKYEAQIRYPQNLYILQSLPVFPVFHLIDPPCISYKICTQTNILKHISNMFNPIEQHLKYKYERIASIEEYCIFTQKATTIHIYISYSCRVATKEMEF